MRLLLVTALMLGASALGPLHAQAPAAGVPDLSAHGAASPS